MLKTNIHHKIIKSLKNVHWEEENTLKHFEKIMANTLHRLDWALTENRYRKPNLKTPAIIQLKGDGVLDYSSSRER